MLRGVLSQPRSRVLAVIALLALIAAVAVVGVSFSTSKSKASANNGTRQHPLVGNQDKVPAVLGQVKNWQGLVKLVDGDPAKYGWYQNCFTQTGHSWLEAEDAAIKEKQGWNVKVTIVSNTTVNNVDAQLKSQGLVRDPDLVFKNGFENTQGLPSNRCQPFNDQRPQARIALALPGKDKHTPGLPVVLTHCGNILPQPKPSHPATPSAPSPGPNTPGTPGTTPPVTSPPHTTTTTKCPPVGMCEQHPINQRPSADARTDPTDPPGTQDGRATVTQGQQKPTKTPNPGTGSRVPPGTTVPIVRPPTTTPDKGTVPVVDPCSGNPNCGGH